MPRVLLLPLLTLLPATPAFSQPTDTLDASAAVEAALEAVGDPETVHVDLVEWLGERLTHPLDVNRASADALSRLPGVTAVLARQIVRRRDEHGPFASRSELRTVPGMDAATYRAIRPFVTASPADAEPPRASSRATTWRDAFEGRLVQRMTRRLDVGPGYRTDTSRTTYAGSPSRWYTRLQLTARQHVRMNLTLENDPGEAFQWAPDARQYGFDHVSTHAALQDVGPLEMLVIGDFSAAFGQGVALWRGFAFSKGRNPVAPIARTGRGLTPYGSTDENHFFRGIGTTVRLARPLRATAFGSRRTLDATLASDSAVATFATSGLHRTSYERAQRDAVRETLAGGALEFGDASRQIGVVGYRSVLSRPLALPEAPYRRFDATGSDFAVVSAYGRALVGSTVLFGEWTRSARGAWGGVGGAQVDLGRAGAVVAVRHYPRRFSSRHGRPFAEQGGPPQNESGVYLGLGLRPARHWRVGGYFDQYRFPWLRYAIPRPTVGHDARLVVEHDPRPWLHYYVQWRTATREERMPIASATGAVLEGVHPVIRRSGRLHGDYAFSSTLRFQTRLEITRTTEADATHTGMLLFQGVRWQLRPWLRLDTRWALFDTDDYAARIYAYEHDLLYTFSVPVFSGRGERQYLLLTLTPRPPLRMEIKYGVSRYRDATTVGSGLDAVDGPRVRELRAQIRWRF